MMGRSGGAVWGRKRTPQLDYRIGTIEAPKTNTLGAGIWL